MGKQGDPVSVYIVRHTRLWSYGIALPVLATLVWMWSEGRRTWQREAAPPDEPRVLLWTSVSAWMIVTMLFLVLAYKVSMVDKHFFVTIPCMVIATAAVIDRFWERFRTVRVVTLLWYAYLGVSALDLWLMRIATVRQ